MTPPRPDLFVIDTASPAAAAGGPVIARYAGLVGERVGAVLEAGDDAHAELLLDALLAGPELSLLPPGRFPADAAVNTQATRAALAAHAGALAAIAEGDAHGDSVVGRALEVAARLAAEEPAALSVARVVAAAARALDRRGDARLGALRVLGRLGAPDRGLFERVLALVDAAANPQAPAVEVPYRVALARALGRLAPAAGASRLTPLLRDRFAPVRVAAAQAVGGPGDEALTAVLVELLSDPAPDVAAAAVAALALQPTARAQRALAVVASDGEPTLALAARAALDRRAAPATAP